MLGERRYVSHEWLRPEAVEERLYQTRILETARRKSTLVVLPTALGKTVIALLLALERAELGRVFFLAPTRPLVQQHHRTFTEKTLLDEDELVLITGRIPPEKRAMLHKKFFGVLPKLSWLSPSEGLSSTFEIPHLCLNHKYFIHV